MTVDGHSRKVVETDCNFPGNSFELLRQLNERDNTWKVTFIRFANIYLYRGEVHGGQPPSIRPMYQFGRNVYDARLCIVFYITSLHELYPLLINRSNFEVYG